MIDFSAYKKEQDEAEAAYEQELRNKHRDDLTPQEITYLIEKNESFEGDYVDKRQLAKFDKLRELAAQFTNACDYTIRAGTRFPMPNEPYGMVMIDLGEQAHFSGDALRILSKMAATASYGGIGIIEIDGCDKTRFTFGKRKNNFAERL